MCVRRTTGRLLSGSEGRLGGEEPDPDGWLAVSTLAASAAQLLRTCACSRGRGFQSVTFSQIRTTATDGARQTKAVFPKKPEGARIILYL